MAARCFAADDQAAFARLSGDVNPLHLDPHFARRTPFGVPLVHGAHLVLWALDVADLPGGLVFDTFGVNLAHPVAVGEEVRVQLDEGQPDGIRLRLSAGSRMVGRIVLRHRISLQPMPDLAPLWQAETLAPLTAPRDLTLDEAGAEARRVRLGGLSSDLAGRYPEAARRLGGADAVAALAGASYIVGMACPGRHSLLMQLELARSAVPAPAAEAVYRVASVDARFGTVDIEFQTAGFAGSLRAVRRMPPVAQAGMAEIALLVAAGAFAGQRALVVGGGRGLGEVVAKLVACGGGDPCCRRRLHGRTLRCGPAGRPAIGFAALRADPFLLLRHTADLPAEARALRGGLVPRVLQRLCRRLRGSGHGGGVGEPDGGRRVLPVFGRDRGPGRRPARICCRQAGRRGGRGTAGPGPPRSSGADPPAAADPDRPDGRREPGAHRVGRRNPAADRYRNAGDDGSSPVTGAGVQGRYSPSTAS
jgi:hypothetical protein